MNCIVCGHKDLGDFTTHCPTCDTDLTQISMLENIEERFVSTLKERIAVEGDLTILQTKYAQTLSHQKKKYNQIIYILLLLPLFSWLCGKKQAPPVIVKDVTQDSLQVYKSQISKIQKSLDTLQATKVRQIKYVIKQGQTMEDIGLLFFNDRNAGYQIMKDNNININRQYNLVPGETILINFR